MIIYIQILVRIAFALVLVLIISRAGVATTSYPVRQDRIAFPELEEMIHSMVVKGMMFFLAVKEMTHFLGGSGTIA